MPLLLPIEDEEVSKEFPDVTWDKMLVDAMTVRMTLHPPMRVAALGTDRKAAAAKAGPGPVRNITDPDSRAMHCTRNGTVQACNCQCPRSDDGLVLAARATQARDPCSGLVRLLISVPQAVEDLANDARGASQRSRRRVRRRGRRW